jgi:hypothetical protein
VLLSLLLYFKNEICIAIFLGAKFICRNVGVW